MLYSLSHFLMSKLSFDEYLELSEKTLSSQFHIQSDDSQKQRMLHAAMGLVTESGEVLDIFKKHIFYGKEIDMVNLKEEIGDILRFLAIFFRELDLDIETSMYDNIEKLRKRYGDLRRALSDYRCEIRCRWS